LRKDKK